MKNVEILLLPFHIQAVNDKQSFDSSVLQIASIQQKSHHKTRYPSARTQMGLSPLRDPKNWNPTLLPGTSNLHLPHPSPVALLCLQSLPLYVSLQLQLYLLCFPCFHYPCLCHLGFHQLPRLQHVEQLDPRSVSDPLWVCGLTCLPCFASFEALIQLHQLQLFPRRSVLLLDCPSSSPGAPRKNYFHCSWFQLLHCSHGSCCSPTISS
ncbi:hypothetical protein LINPERPRIM_LOCUS3440 [Linum perenne]